MTSRVTVPIRWTACNIEPSHALARPAVGALFDTGAAHAATHGRPLLVEVDDANTELVAETTARHAVPIDEVHIAVDDLP